MNLHDETWRAHVGLAALCSALGEGEVRLIGGFVRDSLLGLPSADVDLATVHAPDESRRRIEAAGFKAVPTGMAHGTVTAVLPSGPVEVTTLRRDVETDGRHAIVAFTDDWEADAARRDFTINALSADPRDGQVHDYFDGLADLAERRVRFIGAPRERIAEDHLRILRFFRFHARFGSGAPYPAGLEACVARANDLMSLSRERIAQELLKLLAVDDPGETVALMVERGVLAPVLPEIDAAGVARLRALIQRERVFGDISSSRRLAALLPPDPDIATRIAQRLKLSKALQRRLALAVDPEPISDARALAYAIGVESARDRLLLGGRENSLGQLDGWEPPRLPIGGGALVALGLSAGPKVAATLVAIERRWVAEGFPDEARVRELAEEEVGASLG